MEPLIINRNDAEEIIEGEGHFGGSYRVLTPAMRERGGRLGVVENRLPPQRVGCPMHSHLREDEVFLIQSGRGLFRYGEHIREVGPGDCLSCPAGAGVAHQLGNPFHEDLVYLAIGPYDPHEVCHYPDSGKILVRGLTHTGRVGHFQAASYMDGEPEVPALLLMHPTAPRG